MNTRKFLCLSLATVALLLLAQTTVFAQGVISGPEITAFPDGDENSGKFVNLTNGLSSLGEAGTNLCIETPITGTEFLLQVFDGDYGGLWDFLPREGHPGGVPPVVLYKLYAHPDPEEDVTTLVEEWSSTQMANNGWFTCTSDNSNAGTTSHATKVVNVDAAKDSSGLPVYRYNLVVTWQSTPTTNALNSFKVRVEGEVFGLRLSRYGFVGFKWGANRYGYVHPQNGGNLPFKFDEETLTYSEIQPQTTTFEGKWVFRLTIPAATTSIDLWTGDFDLQIDSDDPNTVGVPSWASSPPAVAEGSQAREGFPPDDRIARSSSGVFSYHPYTITTSLSALPASPDFTQGMGLFQKISDEDRNFTLEDLNVSGNQEWELFKIAASGVSTTPAPDATATGVSVLPAGRYWWEIEGADAQNTLFLRPDFDLRTVPGSYKLGDRVWLDQDGSGGIDDDDEPGINGVTVKLYQYINNEWFFYAAAVTGPITDSNNQTIDGYYLFENLAPGEYKVEVVASTLPTGVGPTYDLDGTSTLNVVELTGDNTLVADNLAVDFSYSSTGKIGDYVWEDLPIFGVQDDGTGAGLGGVTVELWADLNGSGNLVLLETTTTDSDGFYLFDELVAGDYEVRVDPSTLPGGSQSWEQTWDYDDTDITQPIVSPHVAQVTLGVGETNLNVDFGYFEGGGTQSLGSIGDFVWQDSDADGEWDVVAGELPIAGVKVVLTGDTNGDGVIDVTKYDTTDGMGMYLFTELPMGTYTVTIVSTNFNSGSPLYRMLQTYDYDLTLDNKTSVTLVKTTFENFLDADFGYRPKCPPGTGTPGYWKNHPNAWPVETIVIGGVPYLKADAIKKMGTGEEGDKTYTVFRHLVAAKLNVGMGNDFSCVESAITAADAWMKVHPVGSDVSGDSAAWAEIQGAAMLLDKYNNGLLECADSRDDVKCDCYKTVKTSKDTKSGKRGKSGKSRRKK